MGGDGGCAVVSEVSSPAYARGLFEWADLIHRRLDLDAIGAAVAGVLSSLGAEHVELSLCDLREAGACVWAYSGVATGATLPGARGTMTVDRTFDVDDVTAGRLSIRTLGDGDRNHPSVVVHQAADDLQPTIAAALANALRLRAIERDRDQKAGENRALLEALQAERDRLSDAASRLSEGQSARDRLFTEIDRGIGASTASLLRSVEALKASSSTLLPSWPSIANIDRIAQGLRRHADDLLASLGDGNAIRIRPHRIDVAALVKGVVEVWMPAAKHRGLSMVYRGPESRFCDAEPASLERALGHLVGNAIQFTSTGGVELVLASGADDVRIEVLDTGIGVASSSRGTLFDVRGRASGGSDVDGGAGGTGRGLQVVKAIAKAHSGRLEYAPRSPVGSVFSLILPGRSVPSGRRASSVRGSVTQVSRTPDLEDVSGRATPGVRGSSAVAPATLSTILVVEDEPLLLRSIVGLLRRHYKVHSASDGETALEVAKRHLPDLLLTDLDMPKMDGLTLAQRFREIPGRQISPVLILTGDATVSSRISGFEAGAVDYILKPFNGDDLKARIRAHLSMRQLALRLHESEQLASMATLSAGLAHEIRNPANAVVNAIGPIKAILGEDLLRSEPALTELFGVLDECAAQITHLSSRLLGYVRQDEVETSHHRFESIVARSVAMAGTRLRSVRVIEAHEFASELRCAGPFLVDAVANLLTNGADAAGPGGWVKVRSYRLEGMFVADFTDSGPGVPTELLSRVLEPFFTTKPPGLGTGLGLFTVRSAVEKHRGSLDIVPDVNGTIFRIKLPLDDAFDEEAESFSRPCEEVPA